MDAQVDLKEKNFHLSLSIFNLNCWGLAFISKNRTKRIQAIARHLNEQDYEIVFLQEIWLESDFNYIKSVVKDKFKFSYFFKNGSFFGNPGLALFSKYFPTNIHFEKFDTNGNPFKLWHGDWFTGKGVGYAIIPIKGYNFHLFNTHFHAQYNEKETLDSQYSIHRICQSYQLAKFINLNTNFTNNLDYNGKDVIILAGDLNTTPDDLPYKLLLSMTGLHDSCHVYQKQKINRSENINKDIDFITCGHPFNTYTTENSDYVKRIDYIMYKLITGTWKKKLINFDQGSSYFKNHPCVIDRIECKTKCDISGLSFSDHQPVAIKLGLNHYLLNSTQHSSNDIDVGNIEPTIRISELSKIECTAPTSIDAKKDDQSLNILMSDDDEINSNNQLVKFRKLSENISQNNDLKNIKIKNVFSLKSKCFGKTSSDILQNLTKLQIKDLNYIYANNDFYLQTCQDLFKIYLKRTSNKLWFLSILILFIMFILVLILCVINLINVTLPFNHFISSNNLTIVCGFLFTFLVIVLFVLQIAYRLELNSISMILRESDILLKKKNLELCQ